MARSEYSHGLAALQLLCSCSVPLQCCRCGCSAYLCPALGLGESALCPGVMLAVPHTLLNHFLHRETLDFPRSWLLPVLRDNVQGARLGFFTSYFLPLAAALKSRGEESSMSGVSAVQGVLWNLLSLPWDGTRLCNIFCSAHLLFFLCSPGVYPGWEECGGQDLRHAAVAGNEQCLGALPWCTQWHQAGEQRLGQRLWPPTFSFSFQVWTLLPGFCTHPTDVLGAFKGLARTLGMAISERPDLRPTVCQALRTLIHKGCQTGSGEQILVVGSCRLCEGEC